MKQFVFLIDINECLNSTLNGCHVEATCNNTIGSFVCTCKTGYLGDGKDCAGRKMILI